MRMPTTLCAPAVRTSDHCVYPKGRNRCLSHPVGAGVLLRAPWHSVPVRDDARGGRNGRGYLLGHTRPRRSEGQRGVLSRGLGGLLGCRDYPPARGRPPVNSLNFLPKAEHVTKERATEDPEYFHTEGDWQGLWRGTCVKQDELCFDRAIAAGGTRYRMTNLAKNIITAVPLSCARRSSRSPRHGTRRPVGTRGALSSAFDRSKLFCSEVFARCDPLVVSCLSAVSVRVTQTFRCFVCGSTLQGRRWRPALWSQCR